MAARAIWKGLLNLGGERLPVKLYSAVEDRTLHFNVFEKSTMSRITQHAVSANTDAEVPKDQIRKGYEIGKGVYVLLTDQDIEKARPKDSRDIDVLRFVPAAQIDQQWYDRPYYLGPDEGDSANYFALTEALENTKSEGVVRWVMRKKQYVGALRSQDGYLLVITMKYSDEVLTADELPRPTGRAPDAKELNMAEQLVAALEDDFRPQDFHDEYRERVVRFIEAKSKGLKPTLRIVARKKETKSLAESLAASLHKVKRDKEKAVA